MKLSIYEELTNSTNVSVYTIHSKYCIVGRVIIRRTKSNATVYAYVHYYGTQMVRGQAKGGGYDRQSAAVYAATIKAKKENPVMMAEENKFWNCLDKDDGFSWERRLHDAGFKVYQVL